MPDLHEAHAAVIVPPHHDAPLANALLTEVATDCRDMSAAMAVCRENTCEGIRDRMAEVHAVDPSIGGMIRRYYSRAE